MIMPSVPTHTSHRINLRLSRSTALVVAIVAFLAGDPIHRAGAQDSTTNTNNSLFDPLVGYLASGDLVMSSGSLEPTGTLAFGETAQGLPLDGNFEASNQAVESYVMQTGNMNALLTEKNNGPPYAGTYDNGATELANYANTGSFGSTPGAAAFRTFTISGSDETATARSLQVGDAFSITSYVGSNPSSGGYIGISFRDSTTYSSFFDSTDSATEARFQIDDSGNWKIYHNGGTTSSGSAAGADAAFTIKITSETTFNATVGGTTYYNLLLAAGGGLIDSFSIYTFGDSNPNSFWKSASLNNTGTVELGYALASGSFNPGLVTDGLVSTSSSTVSTNSVNIGGDAGSQVNFDQNNTYTGSTTVNANAALELQIANAVANSSGITVSSGGSLKLYHASGQAFAAVPLTLNGTGVSGSGGLLSTGGTNTWQGNITLASDSRIQTDTSGGAGSLEVTGSIAGGNNALFVGANGAAVTFAGVVSGSGNTQSGSTTSIVKDGASTLTLSGANTYTGDTRITNGNITVAAGGSLGSGSDVFISSSGSLAVNTNTTVASIQEWSGGNGGTLALGSGATLTVDGDGYNNYMNSISGDGALSKSGTGTMNLYGTQSYTGTTAVSGGKISSGVAMASTNITVSGGIYETTADDVVEDSAAVTVNSGTLSVGGSDTIGSLAGSGGSVTIASGKTLTVNETGSQTYAGAIGNSGGLTKTGAGTTTLSGSNSFSGTTTVNAGLLAVSGGSAIDDAGVVVLSNNSGAVFEVVASETIGSLRGGGASGGDVTVASGQTLTVAETGAASFAGAIGGLGGLTKSGAGTLSLSGGSTYTGATTISGGLLAYNTTNTGTAVSIGSGGTLAGSGSVGATTVSSGGTISPGNSPGTQTYSSLTWQGGGSYNWQLYDASGTAGADYDTFVSTGTFTINATSGNKFNINLWTLSSISPGDVDGDAINFTNSSNYIWTLGTFGSISGFAEDAFTINTAANNGASGFSNSFTGAFSISTNSTELLLVYTAPSSDYDVTVISGSSDQGAATGGAGQFTGVSALNKLGAGTLVMTNGANSYSGVTTIKEGTLQIDVNAPSGSDGALGNASSAVIVGDAAGAADAAFNIGVANVTNSRNLTVVAGTNVAARIIGTTITSGTALQAGGITLNTNAALSAASGGTMVYSGVLSGSGNITATNGGTSVLSASNSFSGTATVSSGSTLLAAHNAALGATNGATVVSSGGTLALSNGIATAEALTVGGSGVGTGGAIRNLSGNNTLSGALILAGSARVNSDSGLLTLSGNVDGADNALTVGGAGSTAISGNITNSTAGLTKDGAGTVTLSGANAYTGTTIVDAGTLALSGGSAIDDSAAVSLSDNAGATLAVVASETIGSLSGGGSSGGNVDLGSGQTLTVTEAGSNTYSGALTNSGSLAKSGSGTIVLAGANSYTGSLTINEGAVALTNTGTLGDSTISVLIGSNGTLDLNGINATVASVRERTAGIGDGGVVALGAGTLTVGGDGYSYYQNSISGSGGLVKSGTGTLGLYGTQSFTGALTVNAGELNTLSAMSTTNITVAGGLFTSSAANQFADAASVTVNGGTLRLGGSDTIGALSGSGGTVDITNSSSTLTSSFSGESTYSGILAGAGNMEKAGSGTLTLAGANNYTGETRITGGTLALTGSLNSASMIYVGNGSDSSDAAFSLVGTTTLANSIQINTSAGSGAREVIKEDATSQIASGNLTNNRTSTINVADAGGNLDLSGVVTGSADMTKTGAGTLVLSGASANTLSGGLTISTGEVVFNKSANTGAVGGAVVVSSGATLTAAAANQFGNNAVDLNGTLNLAGNSQSLALHNAGTGTVNLGGATLTNNNAGSDTFGGTIAGSGSLTKAGSGTLILSASNSYTGATTVSAGALQIQDANGLGTTNGTTTVSDGAALKLWNASAYSVAEDTTISGTGVGGLDGALYNSGGSNEITGTITLAANSRIGATAGTLVANDVAGGTNVLYAGGAGNTRINGLLSGSGNLQDGTTTSVFKDGAGTLTLSASNSYTGDTRIREGVIIVAGSGTLGSSSDVFLYDGANLNLSASAFVASVQEWGTANAGTVSIGSGATLTVNGADKGTLQQSTISGDGALTIAASGTTVLRLYGTNTYTGATTISGGGLQVAGTAGSAGLTATASIAVSGGKLLLESSNVINDSATVSLSGGTIQRAGNVSEVFGDLSITSASFLDYGAANDLGTVRFGSYTPSSLLTVQNFLPGNKLQFGNSISSTDLENASLFSFSSAISTGTEGGFFTITAVPEPSTYIAAAGLLAVLLWPVRRRLGKDLKSVLGLRAPARNRLVG